LDTVAEMSVEDFLKEVSFYVRSYGLTARKFRKQEGSHDTDGDRLRIRLEILFRDVESRSPWYFEKDVIGKVLGEARAKNKWRTEEMIKTLVSLGIMERTTVSKMEKGKKKYAFAIRFSHLDWDNKRKQMIQIIRHLASAERMISLGVGLFDGVPDVHSLPANFAETDRIP
jgi:hypothetical protein